MSSIQANHAYNPYQPNVGQGLNQAANGLAQTIDGLGNAIGSVARDVRVATGQQPGYYYPQPGYYYPPQQEQGLTLGRGLAWAGGAYAAFNLAANAMSRRPEGLVVLAIVAGGAWVGNQVYDWLKAKQIL